MTDDVKNCLLELLTTLTVQSVDELKASRSLAFRSLVERIADTHVYHKKKDPNDEEFLIYVMSTLNEIVMAEVEWPAEKCE